MSIYFQQDGAPAHYTVAVRNYLDTLFQAGVVGRRGSVEWLPSIAGSFALQFPGDMSKIKCMFANLIHLINFVITLKMSFRSLK